MADPVSFDAEFASLKVGKPVGHPGADQPVCATTLMLQPLVSSTDLAAMVPLVGCRVAVTLKYVPVPLPNGGTAAALRERLKWGGQSDSA